MQLEMNVEVRKLDKGKPYIFDYTLDAETIDTIVADFNLSALRKVRIHGRLEPVGRSDWRLRATFGATVVQPCVLSSEPVTTRIDQEIQRHFLAAGVNASKDDVSEFDGNDEVEPLGGSIDLLAILIESLALNIPDYPRAKDAQITNATAQPKGAEPLGPGETKPFAALAALKNKLDDKG